MKDNYSRNICILMILSAFVLGFGIGLAGWFIAFEIKDSMNQVHRTNLMIIYEGK